MKRGSGMSLTKGMSFKLENHRDSCIPETASNDLLHLAYDKDEDTQVAEKKIMRRLFESIDCNNKGTLNKEDVERMFEKAGEGVLTADELANVTTILFKNGPPDFEVFWKVWNTEVHVIEKTKENFKTFSARFNEPFEQMQLIVEEDNEKFTPEYRVWFYLKSLKTGTKRKISPWHDIPLYIKDVIRTQPQGAPLNKYNFICEIPKWTRAKFEIATIEPYNPVKQDVSNGALRFYKHGDMLFNYGALPQTWESTEHSFQFEEEDGIKEYKGDNDPIDIIEIGSQQLATGSVTPIKVLGVLGMIDDGEMDWKVIAVSTGDPLALFMDDIPDVTRYMPGALECIRTWLRDYKICHGKPQNKFAMDGEYFGREYAQNIIKECHNHWRNFHLIQERRQAS
eukprot:TRINITY_DN11029_c0_g1_i2.p1 TRINITY_DN11029_c0_g1~~TRINITY_DN11029_c0_g1_i2.p1  ORF type:complete len:396 (+),score=94.82 TRINITY_DN11029_c0_g1_i2:275-1462(+)